MNIMRRLLFMILFFCLLILAIIEWTFRITLYYPIWVITGYHTLNGELWSWELIYYIDNKLLGKL